MVVALNLGENVKHKGQNKVQPYYIKVLSVEYSFADVILMIYDSGLVHHKLTLSHYEFTWPILQLVEQWENEVLDLQFIIGSKWLNHDTLLPNAQIIIFLRFILKRFVHVFPQNVIFYKIYRIVVKHDWENPFNEMFFWYDSLHNFLVLLDRGQFSTYL